MEKLTLEHLAPYLPYGLKIQGQTHLEVQELSGLRDGIIYTTEGCKQYGWADIFDIKPLLHPLSDYWGKRTGRSVMDELECSIVCMLEIWDLTSGIIALDKISLGTYNVMCKNHIDFNRLIEKGLAIDINTLK